MRLMHTTEDGGASHIHDNDSTCAVTNQGRPRGCVSVAVQPRSQAVAAAGGDVQGLSNHSVLKGDTCDTEHSASQHSDEVVTNCDVWPKHVTSTA
jgi:hypothetical protein